MQLEVLGVNMTLLKWPRKKILFSYSTPVAAYTPKYGYIKTCEHYSTTTSKHISTWLDGKQAMVCSQEMLNKLCT